MTERILIVDALSAGTGKRLSSRDSIGCGPRTIAGVIENLDASCQIHRIESILEAPSRLKKYDHLAISAMSMDIQSVGKLIPQWKRARPRGKIILGGPIASDPEQVLRTLKPDVLVIGEGESTMDDLLSQGFLTERIDLSTIQGIGFLQGKTPTITDARSLIPPDSLWDMYTPSTTRILDYPIYQASKVYVETIRGCSNFRRSSLPLPDGRTCSDCGNCDADDLESRLYCPEDIPPGCGFCSVPSVWGAPRSRPITSIVSEISELLELGVHRIVLEAPDFLDYMRGKHPMTDPCAPQANLDAIRDLLDKIARLPEIAMGKAHLSIENMKACLFTEEIAQALTQNLDAVSPNIGLETGSELHAKQIGKCGTPQDIIRAVRIAKDYGMTPFIYFIYGLPGEDNESVEESIAIMRKAVDAGAERIILYGFRPLPSSAFAEYPAPDPRDPLSERLRLEATKINRDKKVDYIGKVIRGITADSSWEKHGYTMVYPLQEGPLMTVEGGYSPGTFVDVEITEVLSPGLLGGTVVRV